MRRDSGNSKHEHFQFLLRSSLPLFVLYVRAPCKAIKLRLRILFSSKLFAFFSLYFSTNVRRYDKDIAACGTFSLFRF